MARHEEQEHLCKHESFQYELNLGDGSGFYGSISKLCNNNNCGKDIEEVELDYLEDNGNFLRDLFDLVKKFKEGRG